MSSPNETATPTKSPVGVAELHYSEHGELLTTTFTPAPHVVRSVEQAQHLLQSGATPPVSSEDVKQHAQTALADWFLSVNRLEDADREVEYIATEVLECEEWPNGRPKRCKLQFLLQKR